IAFAFDCFAVEIVLFSFGIARLMKSSLSVTLRILESLLSEMAPLSIASHSLSVNLIFVPEELAETAFRARSISTWLIFLISFASFLGSRAWAWILALMLALAITFALRSLGLFKATL